MNRIRCTTRSLTIAAVMLLACDARPALSDENILHHRSSGGGQQPVVLDATASQPTGGRVATLTRDASTPSDITAARDGDADRGAAIPFRTSGEHAESAGAGNARPLVTVTSSLAIVLGLFAAVTFLYRRTNAAQGGVLPSEAFAVLGKSPLGPRQNLTLVRVGQRILVLAVGPGSATRLAELDDAQEVAELTAICQSGGSRLAFQRTLQELGEQPPVGDAFVQPSTPPPRRGLFASG